MMERIMTLLGMDTEEPADGLQVLESLLKEREATLDLTARYSRPHPNMKDEPTVVFPYTLLDADGDEYGAGAKEFIIPDNGLGDADSALARFIASRNEMPAEEVTFADLAAVEGTTAGATLNDNGDIEVEA